MSYNALRQGRHSVTGQIYLVTSISAARAPVFAEFALARCLVGRMRQLHEQGQLDSLAWVVMPDHLHWLFQLKQPNSLSEVMKLLKGRCAADYRKLAGRSGNLWQANFHDRALRQEEDLAAVARYIVANPLRKGLVRSLRDYPHWDAIWL